MIGIIGAGISGLSLAYFLQKNKQPYCLFEASNQAGGVIQSKNINNYWLEIGPNSLLCDQNMLDFMQELGLVADLVPANEVSKNRYIFRNGQYRVLPSSPPALLGNSFFSWNTKIAIFKELFKKSKGQKDETLTQFFSRHFSQELVDYALDPFVAGIYAGDPNRLLVKHSFPKLLEYEQKYGSIIKGFIQEGGGLRKTTYSFRKGMEQLPQALSKGLNIHLNAPILHIEQQDKKGFPYILHTAEQSLEVSAIALALPAPAAAKLLARISPVYARHLSEVRYAPMSAVHSIFHKKAVGFALDGFGGLNPRKEGLFAAGHIWNSSVFEGKCSSEEVLFTSFVGGDQTPERASLDDGRLKLAVAEELQKVYSITEKPVFQHIARWEQALPQYDKAINALQEGDAELRNAHIYPCANWLGGVSIPDCIARGKKLADVLS